MPIGTIKWFDNRKGFGFIVDPDGGRDIFVHYTAIKGDGFRSLKDGDQVEFEVVDSEKGPQASGVRRVEVPSA